LTNLVNNILDGKPHTAVALNPNAKKDSDRQLREAVTQLCVLGLELQNFDPYSLPEKVTPVVKKSSISVKLNGGLYLSEKTRTAYQNAINHKDVLSLEGQPVKQQSQPLPEVVQNRPLSSEKTVQPESPVVDLSSSLPQFQSIQQETLRVHGKYLENDAEYTRLFSQLTQQELGLINNTSSQATLEQINIALQTLDRSIAQFHQHQSETLRIHEQYLNNQVELLNSVLRVSQSGNSMPVVNTFSAQNPSENRQIVAPIQIEKTTPAIQKPNHNGNGHIPEIAVAAVETPKTVSIPVSAQAVDANNLTRVLLEIVSEKTGYPTEMLELTMDMEADLGIDSIKRVEILGAMQTTFPELPKADAAALAEMKTLGQIVKYMSDSGPAIEVPAQPELIASPIEPMKKAGEATPIASGSSTVSSEEITHALLEIVSEKTGYPTEMLEMGMDMEADLGIDSIKRVEILGAMQERFPELPKADAAVLAEMRTLGQITEFMSSASSTGDKKSETPAITQPVAIGEPILTGLPSSSVSSAESFGDIKQSLLEIVSEKTGYPTEMLELGMDLEADLGIDSIKRVEILGAMQEKYPDLPKADAAALAEMKTLQQIIDSFSGQQLPVTKTEEPEKKVEPQKTDLVRGVISLKSLPLPDHLTLESVANHVSLVIDDGSELTSKLVDKLIQLENKVVVLSLPEPMVTGKSKLPESVIRYTLNDISEESIQSTLKSIENDSGSIGIFIHLDPSQTERVAFSEVEKEIVKTIFLIAKHLKEDLSSAGKKGYAAFITVTHLDGQFGLSLKSSGEPVSGGLFGLTKTLNLEWDDVFCRAIDLDPELDNEMAADCITAELFDPNRLISEVGYNKNGRFTLVVELPEIEGLS
jgi:acyl carrier protein